MARFLALCEQEWKVEPNLNFSFRGRKLFWNRDATPCETPDYLNYFFSGQRPYSRKTWNELLPLAAEWERQGLVRSQAREWIENEHNTTKKKTLDVNPEFSVYRDWEPDELIELEEQGHGRLEAHIMDALEVPLATWGEQLERPCSMAASAEQA